MMDFHSVLVFVLACTAVLVHPFKIFIDFINFSFVIILIFHGHYQVILKYYSWPNVNLELFSAAFDYLINGLSTCKKRKNQLKL